MIHRLQSILYRKTLQLKIDYFSEELPGYFRRFSPVYVRARILSSLTEVLQRARRYEQSVELIQYLLSKFVLIFKTIHFLHLIQIEQCTIVIVEVNYGIVLH